MGRGITQGQGRDSTLTDLSQNCSIYFNDGPCDWYGKTDMQQSRSERSVVNLVNFLENAGFKSCSMW